MNTVKLLAETLGKVAAAGIGAAAILMRIAGVVGGLTAVQVRMVTGLWNGLASAVGTVAFAVSDTIANIQAKWQAYNFLDFGLSIVNGIVNGIKSGASWVLDAVQGLADQMVAKLKKALHINSPSKRMAELGKFSAEGVAVGWDAKMPDVTRGIERSIAPINALPLGVERAFGGLDRSVNSPSLGSDERPGPSAVTPQVAAPDFSIEDLRAAVREQLEITIRDESGRAEVTKEPKKAKVKLAPGSPSSGTNRPRTP